MKPLERQATVYVTLINSLGLCPQIIFQGLCKKYQLGQMTWVMFLSLWRYVTKQRLNILCLYSHSTDVLLLRIHPVKNLGSFIVWNSCVWTFCSSNPKHSLHLFICCVNTHCATLKTCFWMGILVSVNVYVSLRAWARRSGSMNHTDTLRKHRLAGV